MPNNSSLKSKAAKGMVWSALGTISSQAIGFIIGIILARLLTPTDYGLIGMLAIFFAIAQMLVESGFSNALIQKIERTEEDYSTIFYFNLVVSVLLYFILYIVAPFISDFYQTTQLTSLTRILSLNIPIGSLAIVQLARLKINLDFKTPAVVTMISVILSGSIGIAMAYRGYGVWALVIQSLSLTSIKTFLLFFFHRWFPRLSFNLEALKKLFSFSSKLLIAGMVATIMNNLYPILIGKFFNARDVGFYTRGRQFPELLSSTLTSVLQGVTYPILTSLQNERERMVAVYSKLMRTTVFFVIPGLTLFALLAEPFVRFFLTDKWMPIVPLIQWLCFARMLTPISALNMNILNAIGRSDLFLKVDLSKLPLALITMAITVPFGILWVVIGNFFTTIVAFFINTYYPGKIFGYGAWRQIKDTKCVALSTIFMTVFILIANQILKDDLFKLIIEPVIGLSVYFLSSYFFKMEELTEVQKIVTPFFNRLTQNTKK